MPEIIKTNNKFEALWHGSKTTALPVLYEQTQLKAKDWYSHFIFTILLEARLMQAASVTAMLEINNETSVPSNLKRKAIFPAARNHVISFVHVFKDYKSVEQEIVKFLRKSILR